MNSVATAFTIGTKKTAYLTSVISCSVRHSV